MCQPIAEFAKEAMSARQAGVPLSEALKVTTMPAMQALIISAYRKPRYSTEDYRERAAVEFANETLITCLDLGEDE
ncbi:hypothetical protein ACR2VJ_27430 [Klebsiella pneumoniae]